MARFVLDTDAVIDFLTGVPDSVALITDLHQRGESLCTCDVVIAEVYAGLQPPDRVKALQLLGSLSYLPGSSQASQQAGEWRYTYARQGTALSTTDCLIAATASAHQAGIFTGNAAHYPMSGASVMPLPRREGQKP